MQVGKVWARRLRKVASGCSTAGSGVQGVQGAHQPLAPLPSFTLGPPPAVP